MKSKELIRILMRAGWYIVRQNGSHIILRHLKNDQQIVVTIHGSRDLGEGLLRKSLKIAGLTKRGNRNEEN